jgi:hypothetical protein
MEPIGRASPLVDAVQRVTDGCNRCLRETGRPPIALVFHPEIKALLRAAFKADGWSESGEQQLHIAGIPLEWQEGTAAITVRSSRGDLYIVLTMSAELRRAIADLPR